MADSGRNAVGRGLSLSAKVDASAEPRPAPKRRLKNRRDQKACRAERPARCREKAGRGHGRERPRLRRRHDHHAGQGPVGLPRRRLFWIKCTMHWTSTRPAKDTSPKTHEEFMDKNRQGEQSSATHLAGRTALRLRSEPRGVDGRKTQRAVTQSQLATRRLQRLDILAAASKNGAVRCELLHAGRNLWKQTT